MFGECHAHVIMDGINYRNAVDLHKETVQIPIVRKHLQAYTEHHISFVRDGGDALGVSKKAKELAPEYQLDYRTPIFAIHKNGHYGSIVGHGFDTMKEYHQLVLKAGRQGADFIKIMTTGLLDFTDKGKVTGEALSAEEVKEMIHIAHEEGFAVMSHTNGASAAKDVIRFGVDSLEHGNYMDEEAISMLAESKTIWVPTLVAIRNVSGSGRYDDSMIQKITKKAEKNLKLAYEKRALVALGSDAGAYRVFHGTGICQELQTFHKILGSSPAVNAWLHKGEEEIQRRFRH